MMKIAIAMLIAALFTFVSFGINVEAHGCLPAKTSLNNEAAHVFSDLCCSYDPDGTNEYVIKVLKQKRTAPAWNDCADSTHPDVRYQITTNVGDHTGLNTTRLFILNRELLI